MDGSAILERIRQLTGQVDLAVSDYTDPEHMAYVKTAARVLNVRAVLTEYTVETDQAEATFGVDPEPTSLDGELLAVQASVDLLQHMYRGRLERGEFGVAWASGLEQESTISASQAFERGIRQLQLELDELKLHRQAGTQGFRAQ